ncbi:MAG TPA: hypothetical protein O0W90_03920 [Methanocorpusculum sp.]|nr:hypothetical protein [Methanocorpusculum sp.]
MTKLSNYIFAVLTAIIGIISAVFSSIYEILILVTIISVPICILFLIFAVRAGKKEGDIPFIGY